MERGEGFRFKTPFRILIVPGSVRMCLQPNVYWTISSWFKPHPRRSITVTGRGKKGSHPWRFEGSSFMKASQTRINYKHGFTKGLLVLYDLTKEGGNDKRVLDLFTKHSRHQNVTVLFLCQDMFPPGKYAKVYQGTRITRGSSDERRFLSHLLKEEGCMRCYQLKEDLL